MPGRVRNRSLTDPFIQALTQGSLKRFLDRVKQDDSLYLAIRDEYVNIYYRGGNLLRIRSGRKGYRFEFDEKYCLTDADSSKVVAIPHMDAHAWLSHIDWIKEKMDAWLAAKKANRERISQQEIAQANRDSSGDYVVIDIEYAGGNRGDQFRVDMLALRKVEDQYNLVLIENKFGTAAIGGKTGLAKHYIDTLSLIRSEKADLIHAAYEITRVKYMLGLCANHPAEADIQDCEMLFVLVDFNKNSQSLANAIEEIRPHFDPSIRTGLVHLTGSNRCIHHSAVEPLL